MLLLAAPAEAEPTLRLRLAWGGGPSRQWAGAVRLSQGELAEPRLLGVEADEPGSMWLEDGVLVIRQRSPRAYDGVDLLVDAPVSSTQLHVELSTIEAKAERVVLDIPLADVLNQSPSIELDDRGNRLMVRRAPGDELRVRFERRSLIFSPGEAFEFTLQPNRLPLDDGSRVRLKIQLCPGRTNEELWSDEYEAIAGEAQEVPIRIPLPEAEGVYDLAITAAENKGLRLPQGGHVPLGWNRTVAERKVQVVVLSQQSADEEAAIGDLKEVVAIDPTLPRWWERLGKLPQFPQLSRLTRLGKDPLGSGHSSIKQHQLGPVIELAPSREATDVSWETYTLPINQPGWPHVLEIEYPSDRNQNLGISVLEPNPAGALLPIGLDSGVECEEEIVNTATEAAPRWLRHRLVFWPRTRSPMVLITNYRNDVPAVFAKIRVLSYGKQLPSRFSRSGVTPERLWAGYMDRPLFPECFSANEASVPWSDRSMDDWITFFQGGYRLTEYLHHVGLGGLMVSVLSEGSSIYPSAVLQPTPRYDTGAFFNSGQDPVRKDVLEMLFRLFDREQLELIPALNFNTPIPELETLVRSQAPEAEGIRWIDSAGLPWQDAHPPRGGLSLYYNVLHPRVQEAMLAVVDEVAQAYGHHPSFRGLALQLSAESYACLPGPRWGMDDATIAQFEADTSIQLDTSGSARLAQRERLLNGPYRKAWLEWRAERLADFYRQVQQRLAAVRPDTRLYLAGSGLTQRPDLRARLRPSLSNTVTVSELLLEAGIDAAQFGPDRPIVLLRPERIAPKTARADRATALVIGQTPDWDAYFRNTATPASLFFHVPQERHIASFDEASPFRPSYTWLVTQAVPSQHQNRRRFVRALAALDAQEMFDGGWLLPMGQEHALRDLVALYRRLPAIPFRRVSSASGRNSSQTVTVRAARHAERTYAYFVNEAAVSATVRLRVEAPLGCRLEELTGQRRVEPLRRENGRTTWQVDLRPFDAIGIWFNSADVRLSDVETVLPEEVSLVLSSRIRQLGARSAALRNPAPIESWTNPGFEASQTETDRIVGWTLLGAAGVEAEVVSGKGRDGRNAARFASNGPPGSLMSQPIQPPTTGRLHMRVWLRTDAPARQPSLRLVLAGRHAGRELYRFAEVGQTTEGNPTNPIPTQWGLFVFQVSDLPLEGLSDVRVRFDLAGPGQVWIDDVQLYDLGFSRKELIELSKLITLADVTLQNGQIADCLRLLEGYWPRFLMTNVPLRPELVQPSPVARRPARRTQPAKPAEDNRGMFERVRDLLPEKLRF